MASRNPILPQDSEVSGLFAKLNGDFISLRGHPVAKGTHSKALDEQFQTILRRALTPVSDLEKYVVATIRQLYRSDKSSFLNYIKDRGHLRYLVLCTGDIELITNWLKFKPKHTQRRNSKKRFAHKKNSSPRIEQAYVPRNHISAKKFGKRGVSMVMDDDSQSNLLNQLTDTSLTYLDTVKLNEKKPPAEGKKDPPAEGKKDPPAEGKKDPPAEGKKDPPAEGKKDKTAKKFAEFRLSDPDNILFRPWGESDDEETLPPPPYQNLTKSK